MIILSGRAAGPASSQALTTEVDPESFRQAMGLLPTGVTVVAAPGPDGPAGATANAVTSLSLEPMMMLACLDRGSRTLLAVQAADAFAVNVLAADQGDLARAFASKAPVPEKWSGVEWADLAGVPAIDGCWPAWPARCATSSRPATT